MSTPNEENWPGVSDLPDYKTSFPIWRGNNLKESCKVLDSTGLDLLQVINFYFWFSLLAFHVVLVTFSETYLS